MSNTELLLCIAGMFLVTYIPRVLPLFIFSGGSLPPTLEQWLRYVPPAIFGALVCSSIFVDNNTINTSLANLDLLVSIFVFAIAFKTKSLFQCVFWGTVLYGAAVTFGI